MDVRERSDLQLLRVSKGAHELKKMIDYWSKSSNSNGQQDYIFNDLLRGAMELQESLLMLARLQKASSKLSTKKIRQSEREEFAEKNSIDLIRYKGQQEQRLSAGSSSTNYIQEIKQVIRDRFNKFDNEKVSSNKSSVLSRSELELSAQEKRKKAPNLIAKLMGLEDFPSDVQIEVEKDERVLRRSKSYVVKNKSLDEIIETMRSTGFLRNEQSASFITKSDSKYGANFSKKDDAPPIVIMKALNLPYGEREEVNLISETSDLILEDKASDTDCEFSENMEQSDVMSVEKEKIEPPQKVKTATAASQKQLQRDDVLKERKWTDDSKKMEINGKKQVDKKLKAIGESMNMNSIDTRKAEKLQATSRFTSQTNKSNEQSRKDRFSLKSASSNSIRSVKEEKISEGRLTRKSNKPEDTKSNDGKLNGTLTESYAFSRRKSILAANSLLKQAQKEPTMPFEKDKIKKNHKVICEVMPRNYQTGRSLDMFEESIRKSYYKPPTKNAAEIKLLKPLLLSSQSFSNHMHSLFDNNAIKPAFYQTTFLEEDEIVYDQLLLDSAKELMNRKSHEGELSIHQMMRKRMANRSSYRSFNYLLEEISCGIKQLESYSELNDNVYYEDRLDCILEKDLHCTETMLNVIWDSGWNDWICVEEADKVVIEVSERIFFRLLLEVVKDLVY